MVLWSFCLFNFFKFLIWFCVSLLLSVILSLTTWTIFHRIQSKVLFCRNGQCSWIPSFPQYYLQVCIWSFLFFSFCVIPDATQVFHVLYKRITCKMYKLNINSYNWYNNNNRSASNKALIRFNGHNIITTNLRYPSSTSKNCTKNSKLWFLQ